MFRMPTHPQRSQMLFLGMAEKILVEVMVVIITKIHTKRLAS